MGDTGIFIVLEGLDGCGTTTQAGMLKNWFSREGAMYGQCVSTFEPSQGPAGSIVRLALNHRISLDNRTIALLFAADRADHIYKENDGRQESGLFHLLNQGIHVVSDRYLLSSLAYQSLDLPMEWVFQINSQVIVPDLTVFIDIDPGVSRQRLRRGRSHEDLFEDSGTQARVKERYEEAIKLLQGQGHRISRVEGDQPAEAVHRDILKELLPLFKLRPRADRKPEPRP